MPCAALLPGQTRTPPVSGVGQGRGTALGVVLLGALVLSLGWALWRFFAEGEQREAVHVFQYCLLLVVAGCVGAAVDARSGYALLAVAVLGSVGAWAGLDRPVLIAAVVALVAVGMGGAALRSRSRTATVTAVLATVVSLLGALLIL